MNSIPLKPTLARQRDRRIMASAGFGVFQRIVQVVSTLIVMPILLRALGPAGFGIWGAAASLAWMAYLSDIGVGTSLVTMIAQSAARNDFAQARRRISAALAMGSGLAALALFVAFVARMAGALHGDATLYFIALAGLALNIPLNSANNLWMALQKGYVSGFWELVQTLLTAGGLIGATFFTTDVRVYVAIVYAGLVLSSFGSLIHLWVQHSELRPHALLVPWTAIREVAGSGIMFFLLSLAGGLTYMLDNVLSLQLLGPTASARMTIALRLCVTAGGFITVTSQPLWPAFAEAAEHADRHWIRRTLLRGSALLVGIALAGSTVLVIYGERLLSWWLRANLGIGQALLWAMAVSITANAIIRVPNILLNGLGIIRYQVVLWSVTAGLALGLKFVMAPYFGNAGILWGTNAMVLLIALPATLWRISDWAGHHQRKPFAAKPPVTA